MNPSNVNLATHVIITFRAWIVFESFVAIVVVFRNWKQKSVNERRYTNIYKNFFILILVTIA